MMLLERLNKSKVTFSPYLPILCVTMNEKCFYLLPELLRFGRFVLSLTLGSFDSVGGGGESLNLSFPPW